MRWDAGAYGAAFADVYDDWYAERGDEGSVVDRVGSLAPPGARRRLLELGVGTGRLALPLAGAGWSVTGLDSSPEMLDRLRRKLPHPGPGSVEPVLADAAAATSFPPGPFEVVLAAFNFLCNLPDRDAQGRCLAAARAVAAHPAVLVVEAFVPDPRLTSGRVESRGPWTGVRIVSVTDADAGVVEGEHIAADGRRRPWRVCLASPSEIDEMAAAAGWRLRDRTEDWAGAPYEPDASPTHVSVYGAADLTRP